ncbi:MAG TPA: DUF5666 domain-containing protein [Terriglobales bacterium]|nr:DUF5666 domain-containing protein [Terriglobales bacterium]
MIRRWFLALAWTGLFLSLSACGVGGGSPIDKGTGSAPLNVNIGDASADRIVSFDLTINSVTLTGSGVSATLLSTPTKVEFSHLSGTVAPLSLASASNATFNNLTITLADPHVTIINDLGVPVAANASLTQASVSVPISATFNNTASTLNIDLNLAQSTTLNLGVNPPTASIAPILTAAVVTNAASSQTPETGGFQEVTGAISGIAGSSFTISVKQAGETLTFATDSNTTFSGVSGVPALQTGNVVQVNGATMNDGTLLATRVSLQVGGPAGLEVEGLVASVTGSPATSVDAVVHDVATSSASQPAIADIVTTDISTVPANKFLVNSAADLTGVAVAFDASHVAVGQSLELDAATAAANNIVADQVQLRDGTWTGTITGAIIPVGNATKFTLTLPSDSALVKLTAPTLNPVTTITVFKQPSTTMLNGVTITPNLAVRVRGPLFFDGANYTLVAVRMTTP